VRDESTAEKVAAELGAANAIVMRGNGALIVADTLIKAVVLSWFLEDAARVERDVRAMGFAGDSGLMAPEEVSARNVFSGGVIDRMWDWLTREQT
jgi:HCOMODA/2-hydroxy-3-carboxy-muconic semialdehyde decarboxylase